ncbi:MAG TPA: ribbon-helix-helix protein, CopG family [Candidatus Binatia bacterium]|nr:ribbon-helix-helix protein, CopG family [Candidatus Binatia bacterium]
MSRPIQVYLDDDEHESLAQFAAERGWTKSQAVRVAVRALTSKRHSDPLLAASGMIEGLPPDASAHIDRYLAETFVAEAAPKYRRTRRNRSSLRR